MPANEAQVLQTLEVPTPVGTPMPVAIIKAGERREVAVPLIDLAESIGLSPQAAHQLVDRDPLLKSYLLNVKLIRPKLPPVTRSYIQRPGVIGLLMKVSVRRLQRPEVAHRVLAFQRWAVETLDRLLLEAQPTPAPQAATPQPLLPSRNPDLAVKMLKGEVRSPSGALLSYTAISKATGVPRSTLQRWARKLGMEALRRPKGAGPAPTRAVPIATILHRQGEILELIRQQAQLLEHLVAHLDNPHARP